MAPVTVYTQHIPEQIVPGKRLGRHIRIDSRSAAYPYTAPERAIAAVLWHRNIPILDQGNLGSCTGNAITGALGCDPDWANLPAGHPVLDEAEAVALYSAATSLDAYPGAYPPDDTGSDGVSACKAAQIAGLLSGYTHCFDFPTMQQALQAGPVIIGINWYSSFDHPSSGGSVSITPDAFVRGGHEIVVRGDDASGMLLADNSWGTGWGVSGSFSFSYATMTRLLAEQGDCAVPVPAGQPAPVPVPPDPPPVPPVPVADDLDIKLWQDIHNWAVSRHYGPTKAAALSTRTWAKGKGLYGG